MDKNLILKLAAGGVLFGMLFALVVMNKMGADAFQTLAVGALAALGGHVMTTRSGPPAA
jgi:hypothetical protein